MVQALSLPFQRKTEVVSQRSGAQVVTVVRTEVALRSVGRKEHPAVFSDSPSGASVCLGYFFINNITVTSLIGPLPYLAHRPWEVLAV